ncbi:MAG: ABC transporter ATP-binding protein [Firmicutes bacterium]|nr:ABC transporter ATP-binding protein [Bacillota bacterium]
MSRLASTDLSLSYGRSTNVVHTVNLEIPDGAVTSIIGPNGCGKSTLLRALARLMAPASGTVILDGQAIHQYPTKEVAKRLGLLLQQPVAPDAIVVEDLVSRGRYPHQSFLQSPNERDRLAVERAMALAGVTDLRNRPVDELSGGQRQRVWIAMVLAQESPILLLDEPTTYLDVAHQHEVLTLIRRLNKEEGRTVLMVLHDINHAAWSSDYVVAMKDGSLVAQGPPDEVLRPDLLEHVFGVPCDVVRAVNTTMPLCLARGRCLKRKEPATNGSKDIKPRIGHEPPVMQTAAIRTEALCTGYGQRRVIDGVTVAFPEGKVSAIVGPNASGKSTLLRSIARLLPVTAGMVMLHELPIGESPRRAFARKLGMLAQGPSAPPGMVVEDLVAAGRFPYQTWYRQWSRDDERAVERAMEATGVSELRCRLVETLSGGQRQRVWLAMALAQETPVLLLDEPTTFLDIAHQMEVLDLVREINERDGVTVVMVLHDLCQACRYADHVVVMKDGHVAASGPPQHVFSPELLRDVFGVDSILVPDPVNDMPLVLPLADFNPGRVRAPRPNGAPGDRARSSRA